MPRFDPARLLVLALIAAVALGVVLAMAFFASGAEYAPRPKVKPAKVRPALVGTWTMTWGRGQGRAQLGKDGHYSCVWQGQDWQGVWTLSGDRLTITERFGQNGIDMRWTAILEPGAWKGKLDTGGTFALETPSHE